MGTFGATKTVGAGNAAIAHTDLQATASAGAVLLAPLTYSGSAAQVVLFGEDVKCFLVRARGMFTTRASDPTICIYRLYMRDGNVARINADGSTSQTVPSDGTWLTRRVPLGSDGTSFNHTLPCTVAQTESDSTYRYSPTLLANAGYAQSYGSVSTDYLGVATIPRDNAFGVIVLCSTAGSVSGSSDTLEAQVLAF